MLPPDFHFSQNNLQDYLDCPLRFYLKHILRQSWPAIEAEPFREFEKHIELGSRFHQLIQQQKSGIQAENLVEQIADPKLLTWWQNYLDFSPRLSAGREFVEFTLSMPFAGYRLLAKYDLISFDANSNTSIVDWKTSKHQPKKERLFGHCQSRIYPLILSLAGASINAQNPVDPGKIKMIYWYTEFPHNPLEFNYSNEKQKADMFFLSDLVNKIDQASPDDFYKTENEKDCFFCVYRSYCERGTNARNFLEADDLEIESDDIPPIDFDQIPEIEF